MMTIAAKINGANVMTSGCAAEQQGTRRARWLEVPGMVHDSLEDLVILSLAAPVTAQDEGKSLLLMCFLMVFIGYNTGCCARVARQHEHRVGFIVLHRKG